MRRQCTRLTTLDRPQLGQRRDECVVAPILADPAPRARSAPAPRQSTKRSKPGKSQVVVIGKR